MGGHICMFKTLWAPNGIQYNISHFKAYLIFSPPLPCSNNGGTLKPWVPDHNIEERAKCSTLVQ